MDAGYRGAVVEKQPGNARDRILDAAGRILVRDGGESVTIAAVAREAGVSKGGLFYHFASKESLIEGMIARYVSTFDELIAAAGITPGAATLAYLRSAERSGGAATQLVTALLAAAIQSPTALDVLRSRYRSWQARLDADGIPDHIASMARFTVDGMWLADVLDLAPVTGAQRMRILDHLRDTVISGLPSDD